MPTAVDANLIELVRLFLWGIGIVVGGLTIVGAIAFYRTEHDGASKFTTLFEGGNLLKILVVVFVANAATLLALAKVIDAAVVASILSGIVGYVLGGVPLTKPKDNTGTPAPPAG